MTAASNKTKSAASRTPRVAEVAFGIASGVVVLAMIGYFGWQGLFGSDLPPRFQVRIDAVEPIGDRSHVEFALINVGDETAADVQISATARGSDERLQQVFDYVPGRSERVGTFILPVADIAAGDIAIEVDAFNEP